MSHSLSHLLNKGLLFGCLLLPLAAQAQDQQFGDAAATTEVGAEQPAPLPAAGTLVYKSVDKNGKTVFTDTPPVDRPSDVVTVKPSNRISLPSGERGETGEGEKAGIKYTDVTVTSPQADEYFGQETMAVTLSASVQPGMQEGHTAQLYYDGKLVGDGSFFYTVNEPERGTHTVVAKVVDERGKVLIESKPVQFHVRRISVLDPNHPKREDVDKKRKDSISPSGNTGGANTTADPPPISGFSSSKGFGNSGGAGGGKAAGGAGGAGGASGTRGAGGAAPRPGR